MIFVQFGSENAVILHTNQPSFSTIFSENAYRLHPSDLQVLKLSRSLQNLQRSRYVYTFPLHLLILKEHKSH
jgi:hypothetical protein